MDSTGTISQRSLGEVLQLRMQPQPLYLEGFSPQTGDDGTGDDVWTGYDPFNSTLTELQDAPTPEISFYIHDHLGILEPKWFGKIMAKLSLA